MIPVLLILGAAIAGTAAVGLVAAFWDDIKSFLKKALQVQAVISGIVYGVKVLIRKIKEGVKEISRHYSKVDEHWEETTVTRTVPENGSQRRNPVLSLMGVSRTGTHIPI